VAGTATYRWGAVRERAQPARAGHGSQFSCVTGAQQGSTAWPGHGHRVWQRFAAASRLRRSGSNVRAAWAALYICTVAPRRGTRAAPRARAPQRRQRVLERARPGRVRRAAVLHQHLVREELGRLAALLHMLCGSAHAWPRRAGAHVRFAWLCLTFERAAAACMLLQLCFQHGLRWRLFSAAAAAPSTGYPKLASAGLWLLFSRSCARCARADWCMNSFPHSACAQACGRRGAKSAARRAQPPA